MLPDTTYYINIDEGFVENTDDDCLLPSPAITGSSTWRFRTISVFDDLVSTTVVSDTTQVTQPLPFDGFMPSDNIETNENDGGDNIETNENDGGTAVLEPTVAVSILQDILDEVSQEDTGIAESILNPTSVSIETTAIGDIQTTTLNTREKTTPVATVPTTTDRITTTETTTFLPSDIPERSVCPCLMDNLPIDAVRNFDVFFTTLEEGQARKRQFAQEFINTEFFLINDCNNAVASQNECNEFNREYNDLR